MRSVTVDKTELREIVDANKAKHRSMFEQAFEGYRRVARERLEAALDQLANGETPPLNFGLVVPEDHTDDYDTVLQMIDMEVADTITLDWEEFRNYVQDEWGWSSRFQTTTASYSGR